MHADNSTVTIVMYISKVHQSCLDNRLSNVVSREQTDKGIKHIVKSLSHVFFILHLALQLQRMGTSYETVPLMKQ